MSTPRATVRLQLSPAFTLEDARQQVPYYHALGISHFYLSPISCAVPGSTHGYDVIDHGRVNPELGGEPAMRALSGALRQRDMGILLDIVPNHMATHETNQWWWSVLAQGERSPYARYFDIDWQSADPWLHGKVLAPFLAFDYASSLERGDLRLIHREHDDNYLIQAGGQCFPVAQESLDRQGRDPAAVLAAHDWTTRSGRRCLDELLARQHYRLCEWQRAADRINWRRFFEISGLIGVRVEEPDVFEAVHALALNLYAQGLIDGLRIDHVDGLARPLSYCRRLRQAMQARMAGRLPHNAEPWLVVEKILAHGEHLDDRWAVDGTTGYDFMDQVGAVLHDPQGGERLVQFWRSFTGLSQEAGQFVHAARITMLRRHFVAEKKALAASLWSVLQTTPPQRAGSLEAVELVLDAFLASFSVYRTYLGEEESNSTLHRPAAKRVLGIVPRDQEFIERAAADARKHLSLDEAGLLGMIVSVLRGASFVDEGCGSHPCLSADTARNEAIRRFQQLTPPLAAKSLEDTVFYRYGPVLSRNEVGSDPEVIATSVEAFHVCNTLRATRFPDAMLPTATHDHKRGEDARARLAVLSHDPGSWESACRRWAAWRSPLDAPLTASGRAERYMLWQALVGAWPLDLNIQDADAVARFAARIVDWQRKALREAKLNSSWFEPDEAYETSCAQYVYELLGWTPRAASALASGSGQVRSAAEGHRFDAGLLQAFHDFVHDIAATGAMNGLAQTVLRLTLPGIPDQYQGTDGWDHSLVDPDNRRAVDYQQRVSNLASTATDADMAALLESWQDGRLKQCVIRRVLQLRARCPELFSRGAYVPLKTAGKGEEHVIAFMRSFADKVVLVAVPRLCRTKQLSGRQAGLQPDMTNWEDTVIMVPELPSTGMRNLFVDGSHASVQNTELQIGTLFAHFPCAVLATF